MRKRVILLVLVILLLLSQVGYSGAFEFKFISGNSYNKMTEDYQVAYLLGCYDMFNAMLYFEEGNKEWFEEEVWPRLKNMELTQIKKIFDKYLDEHPEDLHIPAAVIFRKVIAEAIGIVE